MVNVPTDALQSLLNRYIRESSAAGDVLRSLAGRSMTVEVRGLGLAARLAAEEDGLSMDVAGAGSVEESTTRVAGSPLILMELMLGSDAGGFRASGAQLTGDAETAEAFSELLRLARPDPEEELSRLVGDVLAHEIAHSARQVSAWGERALSALTMNTSEFLQEESRQLPPRLEVEHFSREVERLRDDIERATHRVDRLLNARDGKAAWDGSD